MLRAPLNEHTNGRVRPFLRWAGGKQKLACALAELAPEGNSYRRYFEPFFGGGSVFFKLQPSESFVGDINDDLCNCYEQVKTNVEAVIGKLRHYAKRDSREFYIRIRARSSEAMCKAGRAARFIYCNKAAFNGLYRVNSKGRFNVPYGPSQNGPAIPHADHLKSAASQLSRAVIQAGDFEQLLSEAKQGDFVYLDPPYPPKSSTAFFNHYAPGRFTWKDQERVASVYRELTSRGCMVMLSNAGLKRIIELYKGFRRHRLNVTRWLGSNGDRYKVHEIVVVNYDPPKKDKGK